jgi:large subunit ribosomal protein L28
MPGKRKITGTKPLFGQSRSKAYNTVKRQFKPNLQSKRIYVTELDKWIRVKVTAKELKTIDKIGLLAFLKRRDIPLKSLLRE